MAGVKSRGSRRRGSKRRSSLYRFVKLALLATLFLMLGAATGAATFIYHCARDLPAIGPLLEGYSPFQTTRIVARDGTVLGEIFVERRTIVPLKRIPSVMVDAVIAAEDAQFRSHTGLDYPGMVRAMWANLTSGKLSQGASTITQQVARTFFLTRKKSFSRKVREILLTKRIEERLSKDEILFLYLNQINFGHARYGVEEAARFYFDKGIEEVDLDEAALLAGIPKGPALYSPISDPEAATARRSYVLNQMSKLGMISSSDFEASKSAPLGVVEGRRYDPWLAPEAVSRAVAELSGTVEMEDLRKGGYVIETTIDPELQRAARHAVLNGLKEIDRRHNRVAPFEKRKRWPDGDRGLTGEPVEGKIYVAQVTDRDDDKARIEVKVGKRKGWIDLESCERYNPERLKASKFAEIGAKLRVSLADKPSPDRPLKLRLEVGPQAALVALDPEDGSITALVGGDLVGPGGFDRATSAKRQPGSAFKPFVYLAAIRSGSYTAATILDDAPEVQGEWQPTNATPGQLSGAVRLREAIARSLNLPTIKLISEIGPQAVVDIAAQLGFESKLDPTPALALGASSVSPLEIASAYSAFASSGKHSAPRIVKRVTGPGGIEFPLMGTVPRSVITEQEAYLMTSLLTSVVQGGTGAGARKLGRPAAGKTGTSNDQKDAWFVGYTPHTVTAVWVGYDDMKSVGSKEFGGKAALPIWVDFMSRAEKDLEEADFEQPTGLVNVKIDPDTGLLAYEGMEGAIDEIFIEGTEPVEAVVPPDMVSVESFLLDQTGEEQDTDQGSGQDAGTPDEQ